MKRGSFAAALLVSVFFSASAEENLSFNRDIRPILSENCYACHGPDAEKRARATHVIDTGVPLVYRLKTDSTVDTKQVLSA